ncbi:hypothetical protein ACFXKJ_13625 [Kitasatospora indigofera]|uniref:hypothetical protein n=1 Tax=Kitasatospora indigofera TaxID=67307 RepID=UPI0036A26145
MTSTRRARPGPALLLTVLALTAAGCSAAPGAPQAGPSATTLPPMDPPPVGDIPRLTRVDDRTLPVEAYLLTGEQYRSFDAAQSKLATGCLREYGLAWTRLPGPATAAETQTTHRYDPVDPADVAVNGYHSPDPAAGAKPSGAPSVDPDVLAVLGSGLGPDGRSAPGAATEYHGKPLPAGGCLGDAQHRLTAQGGTGRDGDAAVAVNFESFERSRADPRVEEVFRAWSGCMKERGYAYPTPADALKDARWAAADRPSAEEIATATADVECKARTNVVGVWFTVESAYQTELIRRHQAELAAVKAGNDAMTALARSVLAAGG